MDGFSIVEKELKNNGYSPDYIDTKLKQNPYGRKFYSDGTYTEDMYILDKNTSYLIGVKTSGRRAVTLYDKNTGELIATRTSQKEFIEMLLEKNIIQSKGD